MIGGDAFGGRRFDHKLGQRGELHFRRQGNFILLDHPVQLVDFLDQNFARKAEFAVRHFHINGSSLRNGDIAPAHDPFFGLGILLIIRRQKPARHPRRKHGLEIMAVVNDFDFAGRKTVDQENEF